MKTLLFPTLYFILIITMACQSTDDGLAKVEETTTPQKYPSIGATKMGSIKDSTLLWVVYDTIPQFHMVYTANHMFVTRGGAWDGYEKSRLIIEGLFATSSIQIWINDSLVIDKDSITDTYRMIMPMGVVEMTDQYGEQQVTVRVDDVWRRFDWNNDSFKIARVISYESNMSVIYTNVYPTYK